MVLVQFMNYHVDLSKNNHYCKNFAKVNFVIKSNFFSNIFGISIMLFKPNLMKNVNIAKKSMLDLVAILLNLRPSAVCMHQ